MKLLTGELRRRLPALYSSENEPDPVIWIKCSAQHLTCYVALAVMLR
jgi:hypothetical protein